jgi:hypothetical protein
MIQRVQTLYLLFAAVLLIVTDFLPLATLQLATGKVIEISAAANSSDNFASLAIATCLTTSVGALLSLVAIFLYKARKKQIRLCYLGLLPILLFYGFSVGCYVGLPQNQYTLVGVEGIILPFISFILILLAIRGIKADEKLVRSLDRIR